MAHTVASLAARVEQLEAQVAALTAQRTEQPKQVAQPQQALRKMILVCTTLGTSQADYEVARAVAKERATGNTRFTYRIERAPDRDALRVVAVAKAA